MSNNNNNLLPKLADVSPNPSSSSSSTHSTSNDQQRRPSQMESYGVHCQEPTCNLSDFLPFTCGYCHKSYCSSHRLPFTHDCTAYDAAKHDIKVELCQWCGEPLKVAHLPGGRESDINTVMEDHISSGQCKVLQDVGKDGLLIDPQRASSKHKPDRNGSNAGMKNEKKCNFSRCKNIMWVEMKCPKCGISYCPTHREAKSHKCGTELENRSPTLGAAASKSMKNTTSQASFSTNKTSPLFPQNPFSKLSLSSSKTSANNQGNSTPSPTAKLASPTAPTLPTSPSSSTSPASAPKEKTTTAIPNVLDAIKGKTTTNVNDMSASRRAAKERQQAALALENRAKKGLLSESEKLRYATLQALEAKQGNKANNKDKDCCIS
ncbi:hypothetical protein P389DRAFT_210168 [Cystobasidium minutum MCA 4210]|uniref:uncharacterized protein n=1 Tax=Cystobasidium minutum MCA 4210 TaxID=1397322 RepID=UPI0034CF73DB|eukprot:jgi/Rhomi1/210168/estExt_Genemark1.C_3_t20388